MTNTPPTAVFTVSDTVGSIATQFIFDASSSTDVETPGLLEYRWDWNGDGTYERVWSSQDTVHHVFGARGAYTVVLQVKDPQSLIDTAVNHIEIINAPPTAVLGIDNAYQSVAYDVILNGRNSYDVEDDPTQIEYRFDVNSNGIWEYKWSDQGVISHRYSEPGIYSVTLEVRDTDGAVDDTHRQINIAPDRVRLPGNGDAYSAVALSPTEDAVYCGAGRKLVAFSSSGTYLAPLWTFTTNGNVYASPVVTTDGTVIAVAEGDSVYARSSSGDRIWSKHLQGLKYCSPAIGLEGELYFATADSLLWRLESDGSITWSFELDASVEWSAPAVAMDGTVYQMTTSGKLYALNADGALRWSYETLGYSQSSPAIGPDGRIYVCNEIGLYAIDPAGGEVWHSVREGLSEGRVVLGANGLIHASGGNTLTAWDPTGNIAWTLQGVVMQWSTGMVVGFDDIIYLGASDGTVCAVRPSGTVYWTLKNPDSSSLIWCPPAIDASGQLFFNTTYGLYLFRTNSAGLAVSSWPKFKADNQNSGRRH